MKGWIIFRDRKGGMKFSGTMPSHLLDANKKLGTHWIEAEEK